jgi:hypothetical protein
MLDTVTFQVQLHPRDNPVAAPNATAAQIADINRAYATCMTTYQLYHTADTTSSSHALSY